MWSRKPYRYEQLRFFDYVAYAHTNDQKLKLRALKCIFVGYLKRVKMYKLQIDEIEKQKCFISRYVTFNDL